MSTTTVVQTRHKSQPTQGISKPVAGAEALSPELANLPFTLPSLKDAIPKHCFEISTLHGMYYFVRDWTLVFLSYYYLYPLVNSLAESYYWTLYWPLKIVWYNWVGLLGWCVFVVGHDCGHRTFSTSVFVNDLFGHLTHTFILVPFHGWRISHRKHHQYHNHIDMDHTWKPFGRSDYKDMKLEQYWPRLPYVFRFTYGLLVLFPFYIFMENEFASGNHFNPWSRLFNDDERVGAGISTISMVCWLTYLFYSYPVALLIDAYFVPWVIFLVWLDMVTYLHHTSPLNEYYRSSAWTFLRGGLSTVDRSYGSLVDQLHHNIGTHVVHHLFFTKIPHYHLLDATAAIRPILGPYYKEDKRHFLVAFYQNRIACKFVEDNVPVAKYLSDKDL